jgi:hypothetical protein
MSIIEEYWEIKSSRVDLLALSAVTLSWCDCSVAAVFSCSFSEVTNDERNKIDWNALNIPLFSLFPWRFMVANAFTIVSAILVALSLLLAKNNDEENGR